MRTKRIHYPINKTKIQEAIDLYTYYIDNGDEAFWNEFYDTCQDICIHSNAWAVLTSMFQPMYWSGTLTVENVYYALIVMGVNTQLEEVEDV